MMNIAICDDRNEQVTLIKSAAACYFECRQEQVQITTFTTPLVFIEAFAKDANYDILLLDICMPGLLGTDVARECMKINSKIETIFITTSDEFAVEAFALKAAHYLVKPFTQLQFDEAMDRAMSKALRYQPKSIVLKLEQGNILHIDTSEICYAESFSHTQNIHLANGKSYEIRQTLSGLLHELEALCEGQFISPYKGYIVNQKAIHTIEVDKIILKSGRIIPITKRNFRALREGYFKYMFGGIR